MFIEVITQPCTVNVNNCKRNVCEIKTVKHDKAANIIEVEIRRLSWLVRAQRDC